MSTKRIHLIGVCGTAMATLAAMLKSRGFDVRGSDQNVKAHLVNFSSDQVLLKMRTGSVAQRWRATTAS